MIKRDFLSLLDFSSDELKYVIERAKTLRKQHESTVSFNWWFQLTLGKAVRDHGWAMAMEGEEEYDSPEFAPKRSKRQRPSPSPTSPPRGTPEASGARRPSRPFY